MRRSLLLFVSLISLSGFAATETMKLKAPKVQPETKTQTTLSLVQPEPSFSPKAVVTTNLAELTKSNVNVAINVMMTNYTGVALTYGSSSQKEARKKLNNQEFTVDRTTTGIGLAYYTLGIDAVYNIAISPTLIFQSEKDARYSENNSGLGLKLVGIFKPSQRVLLEGGINSTIVSGDTKGEAYVGLGLLF